MDDASVRTKCVACIAEETRVTVSIARSDAADAGNPLSADRLPLSLRHAGRMDVESTGAEGVQKRGRPHKSCAGIASNRRPNLHRRTAQV